MSYSAPSASGADPVAIMRAALAFVPGEYVAFTFAIDPAPPSTMTLTLPELSSLLDLMDRDLCGVPFCSLVAHVTTALAHPAASSEEKRRAELFCAWLSVSLPARARETRFSVSEMLRHGQTPHVTLLRRNDAVVVIVAEQFADPGTSPWVRDMVDAVENTPVNVTLFSAPEALPQFPLN